MKAQKIFSWGLLCLMLGLSVAAFFYQWKEFHGNSVPKRDFHACDFHSRMNEVDCVRMGVNPYDVWSLRRVLMPYFPNNHHELWTPERCEIINAYSPWEYVMLMPLSCIPRKLAWRLYNYGQLIALLGIVLLAFSLGKHRAGNGPLVAAFALFILRPAMHDFEAGNFCIYITFAAMGMSAALNRQKDWLAGLFWVIVMLKPQIGLLFGVPLLFRRKWKTCFIAGTLCLSMTIIASLMCKTSFIELLMQATQGSVHGFRGCGLLPYDVFLRLSRICQAGSLITSASIGGFLLCGLMTLMLKRESDWFVLFIPSVICAVTCNYNNDYNFCICSLLLMTIANRLLHVKSRIEAAVLLLLACLAANAYACFAYFINMANGILGRFGLWMAGPVPQETIWVVGSWNATVLLVLTMWYVWRVGCRKAQRFPDVV